MPVHPDLSLWTLFWEASPVVKAVIAYNKLAVDLGRLGQEINTLIVGIARGLLRAEAHPVLRRTA